MIDDAKVRELLERSRPHVAMSALLTSKGTKPGDEARDLLFEIDEGLKKVGGDVAGRRAWHRRNSLRKLFDALDETVVEWPRLAVVDKWVETSGDMFAEVYDELRIWLAKKLEHDNAANREPS